MGMKKFNLQNVIWKKGKYYVSQCLNVDISSFGKTKKESLKNLAEALDLYFEDVKAPKIHEVKSAELSSLSFSYA